MELKYCVSISASRRVRFSSLHMMENRQIHAGLAINVSVECDPVGGRLKVGKEQVFKGEVFNGTPYPGLIFERPLLIYTFRSLVDLMVDSSLQESKPNQIAALIAPFGTAQVQLPYQKPTERRQDRMVLTWTYLGPSSINGISVYHLVANGESADPGHGRIPFATRFWLRIKDSSVERIEMVTPPTVADLGGIQFVMTRIR